MGGWVDRWWAILIVLSFSYAHRYLGDNRLTSIPDDALEECQLEVLDLSFNRLSAPPRALAHSSSIGDL